MEIKSKEITLVDIDSIHPWVKNRNTHSDDQIKRLIEIIKYQGFRNPLTVEVGTNDVTVGCGRWMAAKQMGLKQVPVIFQSYENEEQKYAHMISDNAIASWSVLDLPKINYELGDMGPDFNIDLLGIKDFVIEPMDKFAPQTDEDAVPEHVETTAKLGDVWVLGNHRLMCGDSTNIQHVEKLMNGEKADMVFTDPPYGMDVVKKDGNNNGLGDALDGVVGVVGVTARGKYKPVIGDNNTDTAKDAYNLCKSLGIKDMIFWGANFYAECLDPSSGWIVWDKENGEGFFADGELAWTNSKKQLRIFKHLWKGMIRASEMGQKRVHPTQKPIALAEWCFQNYGKDAQSVLDLFGGSGSSLIACEKTNRKCFMMELDPHYCDVIVKRWEQYTDRQAVLESRDK